MSTRSQIAVYKTEESLNDTATVMIYRHSDGMPESVLPELVPFVKKFNRVRGISDTPYAVARILQHLTIKYDRAMKKMYKSLGQKPGAESLMLGYGLMTEFAGDIEYFYHVSPTAVKVYEVTEDHPNLWKMIKRVKLPAGRKVYA